MWAIWSTHPAFLLTVASGDCEELMPSQKGKVLMEALCFTGNSSWQPLFPLWLPGGHYQNSFHQKQLPRMLKRGSDTWKQLLPRPDPDEDPPAPGTCLKQMFVSGCWPAWGYLPTWRQALACAFEEVTSTFSVLVSSCIKWTQSLSTLL